MNQIKRGIVILQQSTWAILNLLTKITTDFKPEIDQVPGIKLTLKRHLSQAGKNIPNNLFKLSNKYLS